MAPLVNSSPDSGLTPSDSVVVNVGFTLDWGRGVGLSLGLSEEIGLIDGSFVG